MTHTPAYEDSPRRFDPEPGKPYGRCHDCGIVLYTEQEANEKWREHLAAQEAAEAEGDAPAARPTSIPAELQACIDETIGHDDYAPYVLDGQTAERSGDGDDWHDVVVTVDGHAGLEATKFTMYPDGSIEHYPIAKDGTR